MSRDLTMTPRKIAYAEEQERKIVDQFREITLEDTENIILDAITATKLELEKGLESITTINYNSTNNNFDAMVQEIDQIALKLIAANSQNKVREKLKLADSGPLKRCLKFLEENVDCLEVESPSTYLEQLLAAGDNQIFKPIDALPTNSAIKRKLKLLLHRNTIIDSTWASEHLKSFTENICPKKLGASFHKFIKSELFINYRGFPIKPNLK